ncbi:MAG: hypothetical protein PVJ69_19590, partial [Desulfobacteraceae bacterium]
MRIEGSAHNHWACPFAIIRADRKVYKLFPKPDYPFFPNLNSHIAHWVGKWVPMPFLKPGTRP